MRSVHTTESGQGRSEGVRWAGHSCFTRPKHPSTRPSGRLAQRGASGVAPFEKSPFLEMEPGFARPIRREPKGRIGQAVGPMFCGGVGNFRGSLSVELERKWFHDYGLVFQ